MTHDDFDIASMADYLHLTPPQVQRMADRGQLPGRKIGGQWRFSAAEIHHWLEDRIGASDDSQLSEMENAFDRAAGDTAAETISLAELLPVSAIAIPLLAKTRDSVIRAMIDLAAQTGLLWDPEKMADAVRARENLHSTALETGVALMHPRRPLGDILAEPFLALGITSQGIPFGSERGNLTDVFFLICSTEDRVHLRVLARLSRLLAQPLFLAELRAAGDPLSAHDLIAKYAEKIS